MRPRLAAPAMVLVSLSALMGAAPLGAAFACTCDPLPVGPAVEQTLEVAAAAVAGLQLDVDELLDRVAALQAFAMAVGNALLAEAMWYLLPVLLLLQDLLHGLVAMLAATFQAVAAVLQVAFELKAGLEAAALVLVDRLVEILSGAVGPMHPPGDVGPALAILLLAAARAAAVAEQGAAEAAEMVGHAAMEALPRAVGLAAGAVAQAMSWGNAGAQVAASVLAGALAAAGKMETTAAAALGELLAGLEDATTSLVGSGVDAGIPSKMVEAILVAAALAAWLVVVALAELGAILAAYVESVVQGL